MNDDNLVDLLPLIQRRARKDRPKECSHTQGFEIDTEHGSIHCQGCNEVVSAFHACQVMARIMGTWFGKIKARQDKLAALEGKTVRLRAALAVQKALSSRKMLPSCPHCHHGLTAEDFFHMGGVSKEIEMARRRKQAGAVRGE